MVHARLTTASAIAALALLLGPLPVSAQQPSSPEWFVPGQQRPAVTPPARQVPRQVPAQPVMPPLGSEAMAPGEEPAAPLTPQQLQVQLPPAPEVPALPKGSATPAAIVGILSVPDVLRVSTAYQQGDKEIAARRQKLNEDAQKEQVALRDLTQALANERAKMTPEQVRARERDLQDRVNEARRKFGERNRIIQEAGQYVMAQIDRTLEQVAQQVAIARGVNLVLNRAQILGTTADFDLTPQVADVLNKVLPNVVVPPDGVSPMSMAAPTTNAQPTASPAQAASAPATKPPQKH